MSGSTVERAIAEAWDEVARDACAMLGVANPSWRLRVRDDGTHATLRLAGRSRTLAIRRFSWTLDAQAIAIKTHVGATSFGDMRLDEEPVRMHLRTIANAQTLRESMARKNGVARSTLPIERLRIDRSAAAMFVARHGAGTLHAVAMEARLVDARETRPCDSTTAIASHGPHAFGISTCEVDVATMTVRMPEIRLGAWQVGRGTYVADSYQIEDGSSLPEAALPAMVGRRFGDVVETTEPALADRTIARAFNYAKGVAIRLTEDRIDVGEALGGYA